MNQKCPDKIVAIIEKNDVASFIRTFNPAEPGLGPLLYALIEHDRLEMLEHIKQEGVLLQKEWLESWLHMFRSAAIMKGDKRTFLWWLDGGFPVPDASEYERLFLKGVLGQRWDHVKALTDVLLSSHQAWLNFDRVSDYINSLDAYGASSAQCAGAYKQIVQDWINQWTSMGSNRQADMMDEVHATVQSWFNNARRESFAECLWNTGLIDADDSLSEMLADPCEKRYTSNLQDRILEQSHLEDWSHEKWVHLELNRFMGESKTLRMQDFPVIWQKALEIKRIRQEKRMLSGMVEQHGQSLDQTSSQTPNISAKKPTRL